MIDHDLNIPFKVNLGKYDEDEYIQLRIISPEDWERVNWKTGDFINQEAEPAYFEAVILHFHGGGFMLGSSGSSQSLLIRYCKDTGYPIFSVDYRLSPKNKYPKGLSDSFLSY